MNNEPFLFWMTRVRLAAMRHCLDPDGIYYGEEGAKRFARECGPALLDFPDGEKRISETYSGICVMAYDLKPPIDASVWFDEMRKGMRHAKQLDAKRSS